MIFYDFDCTVCRSPAPQSRILVEIPPLYSGFKSGGWLFQKIFQHISFQTSRCAHKSVWTLLGNLFEFARTNPFEALKGAEEKSGEQASWMSWTLILPDRTIPNYPLPVLTMPMTLTKTSTRSNTNTKTLTLADRTISNYLGFVSDWLALLIKNDIDIFVCFHL